MNKDILKGKWSQITGTIQKKWGQITDDELTKIKGDTTRFKGILQEKYGYTKQEAENMYNEVFDMGNSVKDSIVDKKDDLVDKGQSFKDKVDAKKKELIENKGSFRDRIPGNEYLTDKQIIEKRNEEIRTYRTKERIEDRYFPRNGLEKEDSLLECEDIQGLAKNREKNEKLIGENMKRNEYLEDRDLDRDERILEEDKVLDEELKDVDNLIGKRVLVDKYFEEDATDDYIELGNKPREAAPDEEVVTGKKILINRHFEDDPTDDYVEVGQGSLKDKRTVDDREIFEDTLVNNEAEYFVEEDHLERPERYFEEDDSILIGDRRDNETFTVTHKETLVDHDLDDDLEYDEEDMLYGKAEYERDLLSGKDVAYETEFDGLNKGDEDLFEEENNLTNENLYEVEVLDEEDLLLEEDVAKRDIKKEDLKTKEELEESLLRDEKDQRIDEDFYREVGEATAYIKEENQIK